MRSRTAASASSSAGSTSRTVQVDGRRAVGRARAVGRGQADHRRPGRSLEAGDDVGEHSAGLDGRELAGIADEHQPGGVAQRLEQPGHLDQRDHRDLVDHHDVVGQRVVPAVPEAGAAVGPPAEQPVHRAGGDAGDPRPVARVGEHGRLPGDGLLEPGGRLAGRRGQRDPGWLAVAGLVLLGDEREQAGDRGGLPGAGTSGEHGRPAPRGRQGRVALLLPARREEPLDRRGEQRVVDRRTVLEVGPVALEAPQQVVAHLLLLAPVPVEVDPVGVDAEHAQPGEHARLDGLTPAAALRPGQRGDPVGLDLGDGAVDLVEVDADRTGPGGAHGERHREQHRLLGLTGQLAQARGDVHVGGLEHALVVERAEQAGRAERAPPAGRLDLGQRRGHRVGHAGALPSRIAERSSTSAAGGCQENTPHGTPSTTGVPGPTMPRT
jgi:hypothetical protein